MKSHTKKRFILSSLATCVALLIAQNSLAHGYLESPLVRSKMCEKHPGSAGCQVLLSTQPGAMYSANGHLYQGDDYLDYENALPDGKICSAKGRSSSLDMPTSKWAKTAITPNSAEEISLTYLFTAYHTTDHIRYYITKNGTDLTKPLAWSDLEVLGHFDKAGSYSHTRWTETVKLPSAQRGPHTIVTMWPVSRGHGTRENFISCSDVDIQGSSVESWSSTGGGIQAQTDLKAGSTIKFRLFSKSGGGSVAGETSFVLPQDMSSSEWLFAIAKATNDKNMPAKIGTLKQGNVVLESGKTSYQVYVKKADYSYEMDIKIAEGGDDDKPSDAPQAVVGSDINVVATSSSGFAYKLDGSKSVGATSHQWTKISGPFTLRKMDNAVAEVVVDKNQTGEGSFQLTVTNKNGQKHTATMKVTAVAASATITGAASINQGNAVSLQAKANFAGSGGTAPTYSWSVSNNAGVQVLQGSLQQLHLASLVAGNYQATLDVSAAHGGRKATAKHNFVVQEKGEEVRPPVANISGPSQADAGVTVTLNAANSSASNGGKLSYSWSVSPHMALNANGAKLDFTAPKLQQDTRYLFTVTVKEGNLSSKKAHTVLVKKAANEVVEGVCQDIPEWTKKSYSGGTTVQKDGHSYTTKWWAEQHHVPGTAGWAGEPWKDNGVCK
ncbi:lytic polysaccharide monooxygenase [Glaciimonas sp. PCH181]|uniref:lytic polysaccharide monooxygenase n=1 Tax=Glaciimonas sp. PCH181 TaxID=2133943 RepID=UPI001CEDF007|nr:lytic polysaccharide monooxygenase [Glaciimonas sp. PCH181]